MTMKRIFSFIKTGFKDLGYSYYPILFWYNGKPETGYVITRNYTFLWIPAHDRVSVCVDMEDLKTTMEKLKKIILPKNLALS